MRALTAPENRRKTYVKPTMERIAIFSFEGGYLGLGGKAGNPLYFQNQKFSNLIF